MKVKNMEVDSRVYKANPKDHYKFHNVVLKNGYKPNRPITKGHAESLEDTMLELNLTALEPVIVEKKKGKFFVFEGQHIVEKCKEQKLPFHYIQATNIPLKVMMLLNTNKKLWTLSDFLRYWVGQAETSEIYSEFAEIKENYNISYQVLIALYYRRQKKCMTKVLEFKKGELKLIDKDYRNKKLSQLKELDLAPYERHLQLITRKRQTFQEALFTCLEDPTFNYSKFKRNVLKNNNNLNEFSKTVYLIEEMYRIEDL